MTHQKRQKVLKSWPIARKGTKFVVKSLHSHNKGIPILIAIRDMLKFAQNKKEVKKIIHSKKLLINNKPVKEYKNSVQLFDVLKIADKDIAYRLELTENGKFVFNLIKENIDKKISKIIDKKILKKGKKQINLFDGKNFLSDIDCSTNDSVEIDLKNKKISKCLPLKENAEVVVFAGKHSGKKGKISKIDKENKMANIKINEESINVLIKQIIVIK